MIYLSGVGLVLAGGGGKGAYFIGVWKALKEYGVDKNIRAVSGTSVGALNAVLFAQRNYDIAESAWKNILAEDILKVDLKKILLGFIGFKFQSIETQLLKAFITKRYGTGIFSRQGLVDIIDENVDLDYISNCEMDIFAAAYNLKKLRIEYLKINNEDTEIIKNILLASSALPIIFDNQEINGEIYCDGGIKDNVPIKPLYDHGIRNFIVVHLSRDSIVDNKEFKDANIIEIVPSKSQGDLVTGTLDFSKEGSTKRIEQGYRDAIKMLKPIYEMGLVQAKIGIQLNNFKADNQKFKEKKEKILSERANLKSELENILNMK